MALLEELRHEILLEAPHAAVDNVMDVLRDHPVLCTAQDQLALMGKDKKVDVLFWTCVISMVGVLNLFLDPEITLTWRQALLVSSKAQGHGINHARCIREWILRYILHDELPLHHLGHTWWTALEDEDVA